LFHASKTAKMIKVILLTVPCQNVNMLYNLKRLFFNWISLFNEFIVQPMSIFKDMLYSNITFIILAVNIVIKCSFFLLYLLFFYISKQFYRFWKWREILYNQLRIRRLDTWRHRAREHSTRHRPLTTCSRSFGTKPLSLAVFEIMGIKHIGSRPWPFGVTWVVTSSVTWPFDSQVATST